LDFSAAVDEPGFFTGSDVEVRVMVNEVERLHTITEVGTSADGEAGVELPDDRSMVQLAQPNRAG
jgi:hypothetical protein